MVSIVAVNYKSPDWERLLRDSVKKFSSTDHEIVIWDNSGENIGHGEGLNRAISQTHGEYILVLDIDAHILRKGWEDDLIKMNTDLIAAEGESLYKPFSPCVNFFKRELFEKIKGNYNPIMVRDLCLDVGQHFGFKTVHDGYKMEVLKKENAGWGTNYLLNGKPTFYHHWYGTRFNGEDKVIDGKRVEDCEVAKKLVFQNFYEGSNSDHSFE
jgi:hypothetical protein